VLGKEGTVSALDDLALAYVEADAARRDLERIAYRLSRATLVMGPYSARLTPCAIPPFREDVIVYRETAPRLYVRRIVTPEVLRRVEKLTGPRPWFPQAAAIELVARVEGGRST
jgi:hypothetical protein